MKGGEKMTDASRESKYCSLFQQYRLLATEIESLEDFLDKLKGPIKPTPESGKSQGTPCPPFSEIYNTMPENLRILREKLVNARMELEELLI